MSGLDELVNAAEALELEDRFAEARDLWQQAAALEARPDFVARMARCCFLNGQYGEAESAWLENLATAPEHPDAYFYWVTCTRRQIDLTKRCPCCRKD